MKYKITIAGMVEEIEAETSQEAQEKFVETLMPYIGIEEIHEEKSETI